MLLCCPWSLCQAGATYAAKRAALRAALGASIRQPGSSKGSTVAIASMHDVDFHVCGFYVAPVRRCQEEYEIHARLSRLPPRRRATQSHPKPPKKEWL